MYIVTYIFIWPLLKRKRVKGSWEHPALPSGHQTWHLHRRCSCRICLVIALGVFCRFYAVAKRGCFTIGVITMLSVLLERLQESEDQ